jgi:uncharacterized protein YecT (DUF1311 family)
MSACSEAIFQETDAELNRYYKAALNRLRTDKENKAAEGLVRAQRSWIAYRDLECSSVFHYWNDGTIRYSMQSGCEINLTKMRTYTIWKNWLTYIDSTPPILPRPDIASATRDDVTP